MQPRLLILTVFVCLATALLVGCPSQAPKALEPQTLIDVSKLSGRSVAEVNMQLGKPTAVDPPQPSGAVDATYQVEGFSLFIVGYDRARGGTSTSIAGNLTRPVPAARDAFALLGLSGARPDHHSRAGERAHDIGGWREVGVLRTGDSEQFNYFYATNEP